MAILGDSSEPTSTAEAWDTSWNNFGQALTFPGGGPWNVTNVHFWAAGYGSNSLARGCLWNSGGTLLANSAEVTLIQRSFTPSGSDLYTTSVSYGPISGGTVVYAGFAIPTNEAAFFGRRSSGTHRESDTSYPGNIGTNHAVGAMGAYITYVLANSVPNAPSWVSPTNGSVVTDLTPQLWFTHSDPDGDAVLNYDLQVDTTSGNGVEPDWASLFQDLVDQTTDDDGAIGGDTSIKKSISTISRGQWYAARARTADAVSGQGAWSTTLFFKGNSLPTITSRVPA